MTGTAAVRRTPRVTAVVRKGTLPGPSGRGSASADVEYWYKSIHRSDNGLYFDQNLRYNDIKDTYIQILLRLLIDSYHRNYTLFSVGLCFKLNIV